MAKVKSLLAFYCERCGCGVLDTDVGFDGENNLCRACVDKWTAEQVAYWRPLYDAEVAAGLHDPKSDADFDAQVRRTYERFSILEADMEKGKTDDPRSN